MTMNTFQNRKTIRKYARKEVSDQLLNRLLETAERTPTMGNLQLYKERTAVSGAFQSAHGSGSACGTDDLR